MIEPAARSDERLMADHRAGAREAFETLFERYRDPIWRFFRRRSSGGSEADELTQETFLALLQAVDRYEPIAPFRTYLFGIAYNILRADRRTMARTRTDPLESGRHVAPGADPDAALWVQRALETLDPGEREILMLREYEQLTYQEIAELRRIPINTVRSQLFRARMAMRDALQAPGTEARTTYERR